MNVEFSMVVTFLLCLLGFLLQKSKILCSIQMIWIACLTCFNTYSVDWLSNYSIYQDADNYTGFFGWLMKLFRYRFNVDFYLFNGVLALISLLLIFFVIVKISNRPSLVLSLWLIFPLIDNIIQKRYFWVFGYVVLAMYLLFTIKNKKIGIIVYECLILLACNVHSAYVLFIILPIFMLLSRKKQFLIVLAIILLEFILYNRLSTIIGGVMADNDGRAELYLGTVSRLPIISILFWGIWQGSQFWIIYKMFKDDANKEATKIIDLNLLFLILIPLYGFDSVFTRCFRPILLFNYIAITNKISIQNDAGHIYMNKKILFLFVMYVIMTLFSFYLFDMSTISQGFDTMIKTIYVNNSLLN